jgi:hypothetical protein
MFSWVPRLLEGYDQACLNVDDSGASIQKQLTLIKNERARKDAEKLGFS